MAVAEKTNAPLVAARSPRQLQIIHGGLGAAYILLSLWLVFQGLPTLWRILSFSNEFLADALLIIVTLPIIFGLFVLGIYLEGTNPVRGSRASAFYLALCVLAFGLLIASGTEIWTAIGICLLLGSVALFLIQPRFQVWLARCEDQGWFHAAAFKPNQGLRVRRLTVIGIMVLVIFGIITIWTQESLRTGVWLVAKPFSGVHAEIEALRLKLTELADQPEQKETIREVRRQLEQGVQRGWASATDPWLVTAPFDTTHYVFMYRITLTLPLLLCAGAMWFSWRLVNWPTFADFLIATEAEMNKVSWTSRKRLYQDTIVVLATVFLMTTFLFVVDILWIKILTWGPIDVLKHNPQEAVRKNQSGARW